MEFFKYKNIIPYNFLGLSDNCGFDESSVVVLPAPYERTVSFGTGTSRGPNSIISASRSLELYDEELDCEPCEVGIHTLPEIEFDIAPQRMVETLYEISREVISRDKFLITLGGEHSITNGPLRAHKDFNEKFSVLSIDAHCDLRYTYEGTKYSHACVMRRALELGVNVVEVGVRSLSLEESRFIKDTDAIRVLYASYLRESEPTEFVSEILQSLGEKVYITVDVDGFDPSIIPSTGTPEPGGLDWYQVIHILKSVFKEKKVIGMDVVELAPVSGIVAPSVLVAKLVYKSIGYRFFAQRLKS